MRVPVILAAIVFAVSSAEAAEIPAGWVDVAAGPMFTVKAPPGTTFERVRTGDAFAGAFHGAGFDLTVEFGYHREELKTPANVSDAAMRKLDIDSKPGTIVEAASGDAGKPLFTELHVPAVEVDVFGPLSLVITGQIAKPEDRATVERIYESIVFGYKN